jgi:hypothetical protein
MQSDDRLITDIQSLIEQLSRVKRSLIHSPRAGCACDGEALCSHHASVYNHLEQALESLALAIHSARQED